MKEVFKKILSSLLALLVLFSTMSFTVEKHICAGEVADVSFTGNLDRCDMEMPTEADTCASEKISKEPCCKDEIHFVKSSNTELSKISLADFIPVQVLIAYVFSYQQLFQEYTYKKIYFKDYSPPNIHKDIQILFETFLI